MTELPLRFALTVTPEAGAAAMRELGEVLLRKANLEMEPVYVASYNALYDVIHLHDADVAWCPPLVARDLQRDGAGEARVAVLRRGSAHYFSAIVGRDALETPADIKRFGWVSRMSAAGYLVPRSYLASIGVDLAEREEHFFHTHGRTMSALETGVVDAIATYAIRDSEADPIRVPHAFEGARVLVTMGPIPGDVIVLSHSLAPARARAIVDALRGAIIDPEGALATLMGATAFGEVPIGHLDSLTRWIAQPVFSRAD